MSLGSAKAVLPSLRGLTDAAGADLQKTRMRDNLFINYIVFVTKSSSETSVSVLLTFF